MCVSFSIKTGRRKTEQSIGMRSTSDGGLDLDKKHETCFHAIADRRQVLPEIVAWQSVDTSKFETSS
jgi:hypothetical protein